MHNLPTVFRFELIRTLKRKSFWVLALAFPLMIAVILLIVFFSNKTTATAVENMEKQQFSMAVLDESKLIRPDLLSALNIRTQTSRQAGIDEVKQGKVDAFFYYPSDLAKPVEVYGRNMGLFDNGRYTAVAGALLKRSVGETVPTNSNLVISGAVKYDSVLYENGHVTDPIKRMLAPGVFLVLFYFLIALFGNQALTSTTEEKENRVIEMLLTTVEPRTLIAGKIVALALLALIQAVAIVLPVALLYFAIHDKLALPSLDLTNIPIDIPRVLGALLITALSILLFLGLLVAIGSAVPTAKEAAGFMGVVMMCIFGPLYAATLFVSSPHAVIVTVLTYFPLTAPIPLLLRNAAGTISLPGLLLGAGVLALSAMFMVKLAVRTFRFGALEYSRKLSLREIFGRR